MTGAGPDRELARIRSVYRSRSAADGGRFADLVREERERVYLELLDPDLDPPLDRLRLVELGCGGGGEIARWLEHGLDPSRVVGVDLLADRIETARGLLPPNVRLLVGDASRTELPSDAFDIVFTSTVFTSILDADLQARLAGEAWRLARPGGMVLWYDFVVDNPRNPNVRGVDVARIRDLFPEAEATFHPVTLAPPLGRPLARLGPPGAAIHRILSRVPCLRTHVVARLRKPTCQAGKQTR